MQEDPVGEKSNVESHLFRRTYTFNDVRIHKGVAYQGGEVYAPSTRIPMLPQNGIKYPWSITPFPDRNFA